MNSPTFVVVTTPHVDDLADADLDTLISLHLFGHDAWCHERCLVTPDGAIAACIVCGYTEELRLAGPHFNVAAPHPRNVPRYTERGQAWRVIERLKTCDGRTQIRFECMLQTHYHCRLLSLTPRMIGIAALQALEIIDESGYIIPQASDEAQL